MIDSFTLPVGRDPTESEIDQFATLMDGLDWFSDYDCGVSICTPAETLRAGPGQTVTRKGDAITITGKEIQSWTE